MHILKIKYVFIIYSHGRASLGNRKPYNLPGQGALQPSWLCKPGLQVLESVVEPTDEEEKVIFSTLVIRMYSPNALIMDTIRSLLVRHM